MRLGDLTEFGENTLCTLRLVELDNVGLRPLTGVDLLDFFEAVGSGRYGIDFGYSLLEMYLSDLTVDLVRRVVMS